MTDDTNGIDLPPPPELGDPEPQKSGLLSRIRQRFGGAKGVAGEDTRVPPLPPEEKTAFTDRIRDITRSVIIDRLRESTQSLDLQSLRRMDPAAVGEWMQKRMEKRGAAFYGKALTVLLCTWFLADLTSLLVGNYIPDAPPSRLVSRGGLSQRPRTIDDYAAIMGRNLFNSKGLIPGEENQQGTPDLGGAPVRSTLPLNLIGTVILRDELKSIATIEDKTAQLVYPVRVDDTIPQKVKIVKIEPNEVIFVNIASGRREFIDLPQENENNPRISLGATGMKSASGPGIEQLSPTQFNIARTEVDKTLTNLNQVLTQARAVPNFENGLPAGYKLFQIVPGSIYDKLGLKNGDVLCGLNGENINDPGKAFEMLNALKTQSHLELCVKRDGRSQNYAYDIR
jgi:general secretion pathway protein C